MWNFIDGLFSSRLFGFERGVVKVFREVFKKRSGFQPKVRTTAVKQVRQRAIDKIEPFKQLR